MSLVLDPILVDLVSEPIVIGHFFGLVYRLYYLRPWHWDRLSLHNAYEVTFFFLKGNDIVSVILRLNCVHPDVLLATNWTVRIDLMLLDSCLFGDKLIWAVLLSKVSVIVLDSDERKCTEEVCHRFLVFNTISLCVSAPEH